MGKKGDNEDEAERAKRIAELKRQAEELAGGKMVEGEMEETPPEAAEGFWQHVVDYEKAPWTTNFKQVQEAGTIPSASKLPLRHHLRHQLGIRLRLPP